MQTCTVGSDPSATQPLQYVKRKRFQLLWVTHPQQLEAVAVGQHPASGTYSYGRITYYKCSVCCTFLFCDTTGSACGRNDLQSPKVAWGKQLRTANASPTRTEFPAIVGAEKIQLRHGGGSVRQLEAPWRDHAMDESTRLITSNHVLNPIISNHHFASMSCQEISIPIWSRVGSYYWVYHKNWKIVSFKRPSHEEGKLKNAEPQPCGTAWNCRSNMFSDHPKHDLSRVAAVVFYGISWYFNNIVL